MTSSGLRTGAHRPDPLSIELAADPSAASAARRAVAEALCGIPEAGELVEDVVLVTSELVTNALEHGKGAKRLELRVESDELVLRVYDRCADKPRRRRAEPLIERSRGLQLVDALARSWGCVSEAGGKYVWARFPLVGS